jgi:hypothetical protein
MLGLIVIHLSPTFAPDPCRIDRHPTPPRNLDKSLHEQAWSRDSVRVMAWHGRFDVVDDFDVSARLRHSAPHRRLRTYSAW